jgi:hypothetical protein
MLCRTSGTRAGHRLIAGTPAPNRCHSLRRRGSYDGTSRQLLAAVRLVGGGNLSTVQGRPDIMGVRIGDRILFSERYVDLDGITANRFKPAVPVATFAQAAE